MKHPYRDIRTRIPEPIQWHDSQGVPRYAAFTPEHCPDPYAVEALLLEIACQHCRRHFTVEMHNGPVGDASRLASEVRSGRINYGDPPSHDCPGDKVTSTPIRVLTFYMRQSGGGWKRDSSLEIQLQPESANR